MMERDRIHLDREILSHLDWDLTPEEAVSRYLEWGSSWSRGKTLVRSQSDVAYYFTLSTWFSPPRIHLMKISLAESREVASIDIPEHLRESFLAPYPKNKGVFGLTVEIKRWLQHNLSVSAEPPE